MNHIQLHGLGIVSISAKRVFQESVGKERQAETASMIQQWWRIMRVIDLAAYTHVKSAHLPEVAISLVLDTAESDASYVDMHLDDQEVTVGIVKETPTERHGIEVGQVCS